jgi:hypothetical protein
VGAAVPGWRRVSACRCRARRRDGRRWLYRNARRVWQWLESALDTAAAEGLAVEPLLPCSQGAARDWERLVGVAGGRLGESSNTQTRSTYSSPTVIAPQSNAPRCTRFVRGDALSSCCSRRCCNPACGPTSPPPTTGCCSLAMRLHGDERLNWRCMRQAHFAGRQATWARRLGQHCEKTSCRRSRSSRPRLTAQRGLTAYAVMGAKPQRALEPHPEWQSRANQGLDSWT